MKAYVWLMVCVIPMALVGCGKRSSDTPSGPSIGPSKRCMFQSMKIDVLQSLSAAINAHNRAMSESAWLAEQNGRGLDTTIVEAAMWIIQVKSVLGDELSPELLESKMLLQFFEYTRALGLQSRDLSVDVIRTCRFVSES
jgi:hypothetical protein